MRLISDVIIYIGIIMGIIVGISPFVVMTTDAALPPENMPLLILWVVGAIGLVTAGFGLRKLDGGNREPS